MPTIAACSASNRRCVWRSTSSGEEQIVISEENLRVVCSYGGWKGGGPGKST